MPVPSSKTSILTRPIPGELWLWAALAVAVLAAFWVQWPRLVDPYTVEEDARNFHWWNRFQEPELFTDEPLFGGYVSDAQVGPITLVVFKQSPGYSLLFQLASIFVSPVLFSKLLIFPLLLISVYYLYRISRRITGPGTAFAVCLAFSLFNLVALTSISVTGGLQRSFMYPLLLAQLHYLMDRRYWVAAALIALSGAIYPPAAVLGAAIYGLLLPRPRAGSWRRLVDWRPLPALLLAALLVGLMMVPALANQQRIQSPDATATSTGLFANPDYQEGGRRQLFTRPPLVGRVGLADWELNGWHMAFLALAGLATAAVSTKSLVSFPWALKVFFIASFVLYVLAWIAALITATFPLYLPSRYTMFSVPLFLLIYVVASGEQTLSRAAIWIQRQRGNLFLLLVPVALLAAVLALFAPEPTTGFQDALIFRYRKPLLLALSGFLLLLGVLAAFRGKRGAAAVHEAPTPGRTRRPAVIFGLLLLLPSLLYVRIMVETTTFYVATPQERLLYEHLATLPPDILIGGDPQYLGAVPLFGKRAVLFSEERPHPDGTVMMDGLQAYYAASETEIVTFCRRHGVDYLLVDTQDFTPQHIARGAYLFEPYNSRLQADLANQTRFALAEVPDEMREFQAGWIYLVACERLAETAATP
jgi:hypothetical protein